MTPTKTFTMRATCSGLLILAAALPSARVTAQTEADTTLGWPNVYQPPSPPLLVLPLPAPAPPAVPVWSWEPSRFGALLQVGTDWPRDDAARRLVGKKASGGGGLALQWDALRLERIATFSLDLGWLTAKSTTSQDFSGLREELKTNSISLGLSVRHYLRYWLAPYARVAGGIGWDSVTVGTGTADLHDRRAFSQGSLGGGLFFRSPRLRLGPSVSGPHVGLMAHIEGGYLLGTSSDFALTSASATTASTPIPGSPVSIGKVGHDAPYLRIAVGLAF
jgi:hypothetical protein